MRKPFAVISILALVSCLALVALWGGAATHAAPRSTRTIRADRIIASRIELVDANDVQRAILCVDKDGTAFLIMGDAKERPLFTVQAKANGDAVLSIHDKAGSDRLNLGADKTGAYVVLRDPKGKGRAEFAIRKVDASMSLCDVNGRKRIILSSGKGDNAIIAIADRRGKPIFMAP